MTPSHGLVCHLLTLAPTTGLACGRQISGPGQHLLPYLLPHKLYLSILCVTLKAFTLYYYQVQEVLVTLWDTLVELDDLTASTNSIMMLLARILSCPSVAPQGTGGSESSLTELVPRLWPFFRHNIKSVRLAALETLKTLLVGSLKHKVQYW